MFLHLMLYVSGVFCNKVLAGGSGEGAMTSVFEASKGS